MIMFEWLYLINWSTYLPPIIGGVFTVVAAYFAAEKASQKILEDHRVTSLEQCKTEVRVAFYNLIKAYRPIHGYYLALKIVKDIISVSDKEEHEKKLCQDLLNFMQSQKNISDLKHIWPQFIQIDEKKEDQIFNDMIDIIKNHQKSPDIEHEKKFLSCLEEYKKIIVIKEKD